MFYILWFILAWIIWLFFADRSRWREILPVCTFAQTLALATDVLTFYYPLWEYLGPSYLIHLGNTLAIYPVVTYLFIQWLPKNQTTKSIIGYWLIWTTLSVILELIFVTSGHMQYPLWWNTWHSCAADWILYWVFYQYHRILKLEILSQNSNHL